MTDPPEAGRGRRGLETGILAFRWAALGWMAILVLTGRTLRRPEVAWVAIGAALGWTAWLSVAGRRRREQWALLWFDLALSAALVLLSGVVVHAGQVGGPRPFFATAYPAATVLMWGVARGIGGGVLTGAALGAGLALARPINGVAFDELTRAHVQGLASGGVMFMLAGGAVGLVADLLRRSEEQVRAATEEALRQRERAGRLEERERLGRQIHDSVLQSLAMVHKRGRELGASDSVPGADVARLADVAAEQAQSLRAMILREPEEPPAGNASLRDELERVARDTDGVPVTVSAVGPIFVAAADAGEIGAAVRQALENVVRHAAATKAAVFAEAAGGWINVSVRDDGRGFEYDPARLEADGKMGLLRSIKGRIETLGGTMRIETAPGAGTEIEVRVPHRSAGPTP